MDSVSSTGPAGGLAAKVSLMRMRILALSVCVLLTLQGAALAQDTEAAFAYHFPRFTGETGSEITIVNTGQTVAEAQIQFFTEEGVATVRFETVLPRTQSRFSATDLARIFHQ